MAPTALKKLTALQMAREAEIVGMRTRLLAKPKDSFSKSIVQARHDALKDVWTEVRETHSEIIVREDAEIDAYVVDSWFDRIQSVYENTLDEILNLFALFDKPEADGNNSSLFETSIDSRVAKLPKIPLPKFSGKYEDWASFSDLFTTLVHDLPGISDGTKLQYLKLCLSGGAAELIKDVATTNANYTSTWQALNARYNNPRLIINKHLASLMEIPHMAKESAGDLRVFIDESQRSVRALANLKVPVDHWDAWLIFLLSGRLDPESRKLWEAELSAKEQEWQAADNLMDSSPLYSLPKFSDFIRFLEKRAQALGMVALDRRVEKRSTSSSGPQPRKVHHASSSRFAKTTKCSLCSRMHTLFKCYQLKDKKPYDRLSMIKRLQLCFNCFGSHRANVCIASERCSLCNGKHHTLLHLKSPGNLQSAPQNSGNARDDKSRTNPPVVSLYATSSVTPARKVILAVARMRVIGPRGDSIYTRALLDQGSEVTFISESIVQLLGLKKKRTSVLLSGLGASAAGTARLMTQLVFQSSYDSSFKLETDALILPRLTAQLPAESIRKIDFELFAGLNLADPQFCISKKVDIILGADVYGQLLRPGLKRFPSSHLIAQNTAFGWVIAGVLLAENPRRAERSTCAPAQVLHCATSMHELDQILQRF